MDQTAAVVHADAVLDGLCMAFGVAGTMVCGVAIGDATACGDFEESRCGSRWLLPANSRRVNSAFAAKSSFDALGSSGCGRTSSHASSTPCAKDVWPPREDALKYLRGTMATGRRNWSWVSADAVMEAARP